MMDGGGPPHQRPPDAICSNTGESTGQHGAAGVSRNTAQHVWPSHYARATAPKAKLEFGFNHQQLETELVHL
jgi:hypothetical protein